MNEQIPHSFLLLSDTNKKTRTQIIILLLIMFQNIKKKLNGNEP